MSDVAVLVVPISILYRVSFSAAEIVFKLLLSMAMLIDANAIPASASISIIEGVAHKHLRRQFVSRKLASHHVPYTDERI